MLYYKEKNGGIKMAYQIYCEALTPRRPSAFQGAPRRVSAWTSQIRYRQTELESVAAAVGLDALATRIAAYRESVIAYTQNRDSILAGLMEKPQPSAHRPRRPPRHRRILPGNLGRMAEGLIQAFPARWRRKCAPARQQQRAHAPCVRL
ncbi:MAG: hypothetical protein ACLUMK_04900 [Christensenellales bacterium]